MAEKWMQNVKKEIEEKGTTGKFARKAKRAGKSTSEYASEKAGSSGELGKEARLAKTFSKFRPKGRSKSRGGGR
jgi:hypothetical protein